jgi:hypothetical protein
MNLHESRFLNQVKFTLDNLIHKFCVFTTYNIRESPHIPSNYYQIDNVPPKLSIVTMTHSNYQKLSMFHRMTKLPLIK